jgi:hypothetical protein
VLREGLSLVVTLRDAAPLGAAGRQRVIDELVNIPLLLIFLLVVIVLAVDTLQIRRKGLGGLGRHRGEGATDGALTLLNALDGLNSRGAAGVQAGAGKSCLNDLVEFLIRGTS